MRRGWRNMLLACLGIWLGAGLATGVSAQGSSVIPVPRPEPQPETRSEPGAEAEQVSAQIPRVRPSPRPKRERRRQAQSPADPSRAAFEQALRAAKARQWVQVDLLRGRIKDPAARDVILWHWLRGQQGRFSQCLDFLERNGDWPGIDLLRQRCEYTIPRGAAARDVLAFFGDNLPRTGAGSLRLARAHYDEGRDTEGDAELRRGWLTHILSPTEHAAFVNRNGKTIADLHTQRLDMLLWRGAKEAAERMYPLVSEDWQKLARARLGLRDTVGNVDTLIEEVPEALFDDAGMAFERFLWRAKKDRDAAAIDLMLERSISVLDLGKPEAWANRRRAFARQMMREGKSELAYEIASSHFLEAGSDYADLEWLSGYLALRQLNEPEQAVLHFERFAAAVATPISLGRAGYWLGRAHEAVGNAQAARDAYAQGAKYQSSFYGQLAAERAGLPGDPRMSGRTKFPDWRGAPFTNSSVYQAALQLYLVGDRTLTERFLVHLAETQGREALGQMGQMALELKEPHIALMIGKQAARMGHELWAMYFPVATPAGLDLPVEPEFALAVARRESEFDPVVTSPAGARGLMQLMPATAKEVARRIGEEYSATRLLRDPKYNARLGGAFLAELSRRYRGNPVLMAVAYNAGPSRADRWSRERGDPGAPEVDVIDWIEHIPFRETRNYVMRVTESLAPYRARLSGQVAEPRLLAELKQ